MTIVAIISLILLVAAVAAVFGLRDEASRYTALGLAVVLLLSTTVTGYMAIMPEYRLYKASVEKRILVEQAKAEADASVEEARAEVERARGTAEANKIVADSITEPYLRYLYINNLKNTKNQVIYLPTEAGLPILEAKRLDK